MRNVASRDRQRTKTVVAYAAFAAAYLTCGLIVAAPPASAQSPRPKAQAQSRPVPAGQGPLIAVVSIGSQRVTIYDKNGAVTSSPISSGRSGYDTPQGIFSIIEKKEEHFSNLYDDAAMPFMQRITWSGVAMHAGALPGYPASHGCIRLPHGFAESLFKMTRMNMRVVVAPNDVAPMSIAHPALFQPKITEIEATPAPAAPQAPAQSRPAPTFHPIDAGASVETPMMLGGRLPKPELPEAILPPVQAQKAVLAPLDLARAARAIAAKKAAASVKAADDAKLLVRVKLAEAAKAQRSIGPLDFVQRRAEGRATAAERLIAIAKTEELAEKAKAVHAKAQEEAVTAAKATVEARAAAILRQAEAKAATEAVKSTEQARTAALAEARQAERLTEPVSVFVSRKTGRVYIRQARHPVLDMAVTIADPARPIGTMVFTVIDTANGGATARWNVVGVQAPAGSGRVVQETDKKGRKVQVTVGPPAQEIGRAALDRIEFPPEALARITPYMQAGSSLIVSDMGPSVETGQGTDFVVQTRGEESSIESQKKYTKEKAQQLRQAQEQRLARRDR